jgi:hypothetical protein
MMKIQYNKLLHSTKVRQNWYSFLAAPWKNIRLMKPGCLIMRQDGGKSRIWLRLLNDYPFIRTALKDYEVTKSVTKSGSQLRIIDEQLH